MKMTIDKGDSRAEWSLYGDRNKEEAKEFKAMHTDGDLLRAFRDALESLHSEKYRSICLDLYGCLDICSVSVTAFYCGYACESEDSVTDFSVDITAEGYDAFYKLHFYTDKYLHINMDNLPMPIGGRTLAMFDTRKYTKTFDNNHPV